MTSTASESSGNGRGAHGQFDQTRWTVVLKARDWRSPDAQQALQKLCQIYWTPVYVFIRGRGKSPQDAEDLTQDFFCFLLSKDVLSRVDREKGRFRSFLRVTLTNFLHNEYHKQTAQKRAPQNSVVSFDVSAVEKLVAQQAAHDSAPDRQYDRAWALALLEQILRRLRAEEEVAGRRDRFDRLQPCLTAESDVPTYAEVARPLGLTEAAVKMSVHRLRQRYRELLREEIAHTVHNPADIDEEIRHLFEALQR